MPREPLKLDYQSPHEIQGAGPRDPFPRVVLCLLACAAICLRRYGCLTPCVLCALLEEIPEVTFSHGGRIVFDGGILSLLAVAFLMCAIVFHWAGRRRIRGFAFLFLLVMHAMTLGLVLLMLSGAFEPTTIRR